MSIDLLFKIAAIGILVAVLYQVLVRAGRRPSHDDNISRSYNCTYNGNKRSKFTFFNS